MKNIIDFEDFNSVDIRIGKVLNAVYFEKAKKPAYQLLIDFGLLGKLKSSAQITDLYSPVDLIGQQIIAVVNIGERKISDFKSQCLVLGVSTQKGVTLLKPDKKILNGSPVL